MLDFNEHKCFRCGKPMEDDSHKEWEFGSHPECCRGGCGTRWENGRWLHPPKENPYTLALAAAQPATLGDRAGYQVGRLMKFAGLLR
jgi:hypothetical protein